ncbi:MAG TPA: response regulator [Longimicrobiales bacterium]
MSEKTVLLIEDNPGDRAVYGNILWYNGFDVAFAEDGESGIRLAHELKPDLILLDLQLPLLHGSEVMSRLKQDDNTKNIPIVALTARRLSELGANATVLGYAQFLEKPISPLEVLRVVEGLIGRAQIDQRTRPQRAEMMHAQLQGTVRAPEAEVAPQVPPEVAVIAHKLAEDADEVIGIWEDLVVKEPWFTLPREDRAGFMKEIVTSLAEAALLTSFQEDACRKIVVAAAAHGRGRHTQNIPESVIPIEFHLLRQAIWDFISQQFEPSESVHQAIRATDVAVSLSLNACMWGYFRDEIEAQGLWDVAVERLIESACTVARKQEPATG